jgi:hypothetical protein
MRLVEFGLIDIGVGATLLTFVITGLSLVLVRVQMSKAAVWLCAIGGGIAMLLLALIVHFDIHMSLNEILRFYIPGVLWGGLLLLWGSRLLRRPAKQSQP